MTAGWLVLPSSSLPEGDDWLSPEETKVLAGLKFPKRRAEWRLGRWVAKRAVATIVDVDELRRVQIVAAEDGAPEPFIDGHPIDFRISISHRGDVAACVVVPEGPVGCDLEAIEARTSRFVHDFFTTREREWAETGPSPERDLRVALTWSAKESALKALRVGLRRDTRNMEVEVHEPYMTEECWHSFVVTARPEGHRMHGWWRRLSDMVLTVICDGQSAPTSTLRP